MLRSVKFLGICVATCVLVSLLCGTSIAGTIIKLGLGSDTPPDIEFDGTTLSTIDDGDAGTTGDQNTNVDFLDFLTSFSNILTPTASYSLNGLTTAGPASVIAGVLVIQDFTGGTFELWDPANMLLLSGMLDDSTLAGPIGPPATGALFTTSFSMVTGGLLKPLIDMDSLSVSMSFTDINSGIGLTVTGIGAAPLLNPFAADATLNKAADQAIPEPGAMTLAAVATGLTIVFVSRRRSPSRLYAFA